MEAGLEAVLRRARRREPEALAALVDAYSPRIYGLLFRLTGSRDVADDLLQETFLRLVRTIEEYEEAGKFEAWLFRIAANLARDHARRGKRRGVTATLEGTSRDGLSAVDVADAAAEEPTLRLARFEESSRLSACLARLNETDREIILLRHFGELPFKEIAEMLGVPLGTALARAHRALGKMRQELGDETAA